MCLFHFVAPFFWAHFQIVKCWCIRVSYGADRISRTLTRALIKSFQLSGGQQQLVGIARAVITTPKLILADEPTGNLNSAQGEEIMDMFKTLNQGGTTIIQVTHSEKNAAYGSRIINLLDGRVEQKPG